MVLGDEADLVPMVVFSVASRVVVGMSVLFVLNKDHLYHLGPHIARAGLHHFRVHRDRLSLANPVSPPLIRPSSSANTSIVLKHLVTRAIQLGYQTQYGSQGSYQALGSGASTSRQGLCRGKDKGKALARAYAV